MKDEIEESNRHLREAWQLYARVSPHGEAFDRDGWSVANACQPWFFMNVGVLRGPVVDARDLQRRAQQTTTYFAARSNPWVLTASEDWFGENATSVLADVGLAYKLDLMGMATERVSPPTRPLPDVRLRRIDDEENRFALTDLNADSYRYPGNGDGRRSAALPFGRAQSSGRSLTFETSRHRAHLPFSSTTRSISAG